MKTAMRKEIMEALQADYSAQQQRDAEENLRRREEAERRSPEIARILQARQNMIYGSIRGILAGRKSADDLPGQMTRLSGQLREALKAAGLPEDYLEPVYRCPICQDTGYVGENDRRMCGCLREAYHRRLYQAVGLDEKEEQSFERFDLNVFPDRQVEGKKVTQRGQMNTIRNVCREWVEAYPAAPTRDVVLSGKSGLGKTYLLHCMARVLLDRGVNVLLLSAYQMLAIARRAYFDHQEEEFENVLQAEVLILDDLGGEPMVENVTIVQLLRLLDERQIAGRSTLISTNLSGEELKARYTERVASRLLDERNCLFIPLAGSDVRRPRAATEKQRSAQ